MTSSEPEVRSKVSLLRTLLLALLFALSLALIFVGLVLGNDSAFWMPWAVLLLSSAGLWMKTGRPLNEPNDRSAHLPEDDKPATN